MQSVQKDPISIINQPQIEYPNNFLQKKSLGIEKEIRSIEYNRSMCLEKCVSLPKSTFLIVIKKVCKLFAKIILCGFIGYTLNYPAVLLIDKFVPGIAYLPLHSWIECIYLTIISPILEELCFRKTIPDYLLPPTLSDNKKCIITSVLFVAIHLPRFFEYQSDIWISSRQALSITSIQTSFCVILGLVCWLSKIKIGMLGSIALHMGYNFHSASVRMLF